MAQGSGLVGAGCQETKMKVEEIAKLVEGCVDGDGSRILKAVAGLESAGPDDITFAEGERALQQASGSSAGCILVPAGASVTGKTTIAVSHPKLALIRAAQALLPQQQPESSIHPTAIVAPDALLSAEVSVGPHAVIEAGARVGPRASIGARVHVGRGVEIGADSMLYPGVALYPGVRIGSRVVIHAGAVIGADGFGYVFAEGRHHKFPQLGQVIIEDDVEIGANTTIDRGSLGNTLIGQGTKIDNLVQIAHNVRVGRHCVIAAQTGISGSVEIGNYVVIGGQVGIGDKVRIEDQVIVGAQAGIPTGKILRRGSAVWGTPARPMTEFKKSYAQVANLPRLAKKLDELAKLVRANSTRG
jgi:UDP-3-O-[3-hydroxymyristoyl] glucosamine N-acyltransferase